MEEGEGSPRPKRKTPDPYPKPSTKPPKAFRALKRGRKEERGGKEEEEEEEEEEWGEEDIVDAIDSFSQLPDVIIGDILLSVFSVRDIAWACRANKKVASICDTVEFWRALYYGDRSLQVPLNDLADFVRSSQLSLAELKNLYEWEDTVNFLKERNPKYLPRWQWDWRALKSGMNPREYVEEVAIPAAFATNFKVAIEESQDPPTSEPIESEGESVAYDRIRMPRIDEDFLELPLESPAGMRHRTGIAGGLAVRMELSYDDGTNEQEDDEKAVGIWDPATAITSGQLDVISDTGASSWSLESERIARWDASREGAVIRSFRYRIRLSDDVKPLGWMKMSVSSIYLESPFETSIGRIVEPLGWMPDYAQPRHPYPGFEFEYRSYLYWMNRDKMHLSDPAIYPDSIDVFLSEMATYNLESRPIEKEGPFVPYYPSVERHQIFRRRWIWNALPPGSAETLGYKMEMEVGKMEMEVGKMEIGEGEEEARGLLTVEGQPSERYRLVSPPESRNPVPPSRRYVSISDGGSPLCRRGHELPDDLAITWFEWNWVGPDLYCPVCGPADGR